MALLFRRVNSICLNTVRHEEPNAFKTPDLPLLESLLLESILEFFRVLRQRTTRPARGKYAGNY